MRIQLAVDAALAVVVLLTTATLSVFKPRGTLRVRQRRALTP
ncbi:hypothetical protein AB0K15_32665 [Amycolatopsis sp. NPDC049253]